MTDIKDYLSKRREVIDSYLRTYFSKHIKPELLHSSMTYSLFAGGKRLRPILALASYESFDRDFNKILPQASSLELIHTYSLIHDDLPAMDNDDMRRGKPTNHMVFGEAIAILAGDGLLTEAFHMMSQTEDIPSHLLIRVINDVARYAGIYGMVAGQCQDIISENSEPDEETLRFIHYHKTSALITASIRMGAILAETDENILSLFTRYGENIGMAFQIIDDILDVEGDPGITGKRTGSDQRKKKITYPSIYGIERSKEIARTLIDEALSLIESSGIKDGILKAIAIYITERKS